MSSELGMTGLDQGWCAKTNMPSVKAHPAIVQQFIDSKLREGCMFGPFANIVDLSSLFLMPILPPRRETMMVPHQTSPQCHTQKWMT